MRDIVFNDWKIGKKIGTGQNSVVYLATKKVDEVDVKCAVKYISLPNKNVSVKDLIDAGIIKNENELNSYYNDLVCNIKKEYMIMKKFADNPYFVNYYEYFEERKNDGSGIDIYIRMELVKDLSSYYSKRIVDEDEVLKIGLDISNALEVCEKRKIFHRDIKPSNIFYGSDGNFKLGDFDVSTTSAFIGSDGKIVGTYAYMSKEAYNKEEINSTTDIYSLGLVMYQLLNNNKLPFEGKDTNITKATEIRLSGKKIPKIAGVSSSTMNIVLKACKYDSNDRYSDVLSFRKDMQSSLKIDVVENKKEATSSEKTISIYNSDFLEKETVSINDLKKSKKKKKEDNSRKKRLIILILFLLLFILFLLIISRFIFTKCKDGYVRDGLSCVKGYYYCDDDYSLNDDDKCVKILETVNAEVITICNDGFIYSNGKCIKTDTKNAKEVYSCKSGYTLKNNSCVLDKNVAAKKDYYCSKGYTLLNNECIKSTTISAKVTTYCNNGYTLSNNVCKNSYYDNSKLKSDKKCNSGCTLSGNTCNCSKAADYYFYPFCAKGTYSYSDRKCHYTETPSTSYSCTSGTYKNNSCYIEEIIAVNKKYSCNSGYNLVGTNCVKNEKVAASVKYSCSNGYTLKGDRCYMSSVLTPTKKVGCENGYVYNGKNCVKQETQVVKYEYKCSENYEFSEKEKVCIKYKEVNPKIKREE